MVHLLLMCFRLVGNRVIDSRFGASIDLADMVPENFNFIGVIGPCRATATGHHPLLNRNPPP
jgi:hypothetical protein